ncbi:MAG: acetate--CoA ligase family protein [Armatimonadota bacterium]|nr:acetate--CoA ligase family protein [Armatimonadota bacterium]
MDQSLLPFFRPRGIVLVGASRDPSKLGYGVAQNLVRCGFPGAVHFVNPRGGRLFDRPVYADLSLVPDPVDLAVLVIPAPAVPDALRACSRRGVRAAVVLSGGFRETGPAGAALEAECARIARESGIRLLGPNCVGLIDTHLPLDATFLPPPGPPAGDVAFISHSGAICAAVTDWASGQGFGLSYLISLGNQADVTETDMLEAVAEDPHTRVITLYLEGVETGRRFVEVAGRIARDTPIVVLKVGRSAAGRRAVVSHTGALARQEAAYAAAFRRAGVIQAETGEEVVDWARALAWCPLPAGRAMAVLTNAGGPGVMAADALEACGLTLADLQDDTRATLRAMLPPAAAVHNPVDILASASPALYADCLRVVLSDPDVHGVLVILPPPPRDPAESVAEAIIPVIRRTAKPVVVALMGEHAIRAASDRLRAARIPDYPFPERAASALAVLVRRVETLARPQLPPAAFDDIRAEAVRRVLADTPRGTEGFLASHDAGRVLHLAGIPVPRGGLARTPEDAAALAGEIGFPVVLKVASPDIPHKSDVGGVLLDVRDDAGVAEGAAALLARVRTARPQARILGVSVEHMLPPGQDVIVGAVQDPQFGALVMFGSGGVEVEGLGDVAFALAPLSRQDAEDLLERTWAGRRLRGYRSLPPADRDAVIEVVLRVAHLASVCPELAEVEINPLRVLPEGRGAVAADVRLRVGRGGRGPAVPGSA